MYFSVATVVFALMVQQTAGFSFGPINPWSGIKTTTPTTSAVQVHPDGDVTFPKNILGNKVLLGNTIFLDSDILPVNDLFVKIGGSALSDIPSLWMWKIHQLKKLIDPSVLAALETCPITGRRLAKLEVVKKLLSVVNFDAHADHFLGCNTGVPTSDGIMPGCPIIAPTDMDGVSGLRRLKSLFADNTILGPVTSFGGVKSSPLLHLLKMVAPESALLQPTYGTTGSITTSSGLDWKEQRNIVKLLSVLSIVEPALLTKLIGMFAAQRMLSPTFAHFPASTPFLDAMAHCSTFADPYTCSPAAMIPTPITPGIPSTYSTIPATTTTTEKPFLDVQETPTKFKVTLRCPFVTTPEDVKVHFSADGQLVITTPALTKTIPLPVHVIDLSAVQVAVSPAGLLTVKVPKKVGSFGSIGGGGGGSYGASQDHSGLIRNILGRVMNRI